VSAVEAVSAAAILKGQRLWDSSTGDGGPPMRHEQFKQRLKQRITDVGEQT